MKNYSIENLPQIRGKYLFNETLKNYTWLNTGGPAEILFLPQDVEDLQNFMRNKDKNMPFFILGGGANLLIRDGGIEGVVIKLKNQNFAKVKIEKDKIYCGAGLQNILLKKILPQHNAGGLEFLCSIPGTIGGAVRGNAGCFGSDISQVLLSAQLMDENGEIINMEKNDFHFTYRRSNLPENLIILEVCLQTNFDTAENILKKIKENDEYRKMHQPQKIRTAGSTFKNPPNQRAWELIKKSGSHLIDINGAHLSSSHCNFLDNNAGANAQSIELLCNKIMAMVKENCGVDLELEIKIVGHK